MKQPQQFRIGRIENILDELAARWTAIHGAFSGTPSDYAKGKLEEIEWLIEKLQNEFILKK